MKRVLLLCLLCAFLGSCKSKSGVVTTKSGTYKTKRPVASTTKNTTTSKNTSTTPTSTTTERVSYGNSTADKIIKKALSYKGTKYKYGGMSKSGMDCSGLMLVSYKSQNINLPRSSYDQSKEGKKIAVSKAQKGDLVFFKTTRKNRITHVGLVIENRKGEVRFIHSSTSRGVMVSSLKEGYWKNAFVEARRLL